MHSLMSCVIAAIVVYICFKIFKKIVKAIIVGVICGTVYYLLTHPEQMSYIVTQISTLLSK